MKASGPRQERETVIVFNEQDEEAWIWTASQSVFLKLAKRLGSDFQTDYSERHAEFTFPKKWITLPRKKAKRQGNKGLEAIQAKKQAQAPHSMGAK